MAWRDHAACRGTNPDLFHPERGDTETVRAALAVCAACPVQPECATASAREPIGIWGGTTAAQRERNRPPTPPKTRPVCVAQGCASPVRVRLWCARHYQIIARHGAIPAPAWGEHEGVL